MAKKFTLEDTRLYGNFINTLPEVVVTAKKPNNPVANFTSEPEKSPKLTEEEKRKQSKFTSSVSAKTNNVGNQIQKVLHTGVGFTPLWWTLPIAEAAVDAQNKEYGKVAKDLASGVVAPYAIGKVLKYGTLATKAVKEEGAAGALFNHVIRPNKDNPMFVKVTDKIIDNLPQKAIDKIDYEIGYSALKKMEKAVKQAEPKMIPIENAPFYEGLKASRGVNKELYKVLDKVDNFSDYVTRKDIDVYNRFYHENSNNQFKMNNDVFNKLPDNLKLYYININHKPFNGINHLSYFHMNPEQTMQQITKDYNSLKSGQYFDLAYNGAVSTDSYPLALSKMMSGAKKGKATITVKRTIDDKPYMIRLNRSGKSNSRIYSESAKPVTITDKHGNRQHISQIIKNSDYNSTQVPLKFQENKINRAIDNLSKELNIKLPNAVYTTNGYYYVPGIFSKIK